MALGEVGDGTAIRLIGELTPDVVIMDVIMPNQNGIKTTSQVASLYPPERCNEALCTRRFHFLKWEGLVRCAKFVSLMG